MSSMKEMSIRDYISKIDFKNDDCLFKTPMECHAAKGIFLGFGHLCEECETI